MKNKLEQQMQVMHKNYGCYFLPVKKDESKTITNKYNVGWNRRKLEIPDVLDESDRVSVIVGGNDLGVIDIDDDKTCELVKYFFDLDSIVYTSRSQKSVSHIIYKIENDVSNGIFHAFHNDANKKSKGGVEFFYNKNTPNKQVIISGEGKYKSKTDGTVYDDTIAIKGDVNKIPSISLKRLQANIGNLIFATSIYRHCLTSEGGRDIMMLSYIKHLQDSTELNDDQIDALVGYIGIQCGDDFTPAGKASRVKEYKHLKVATVFDEIGLDTKQKTLMCSYLNVAGVEGDGTYGEQYKNLEYDGLLLHKYIYDELKLDIKVLDGCGDMYIRKVGEDMDKWVPLARPQQETVKKELAKSLLKKNVSEARIRRIIKAPEKLLAVLNDCRTPEDINKYTTNRLVEYGERIHKGKKGYNRKAAIKRRKEFLQNTLGIVPKNENERYKLEQISVALFRNIYGKPFWHRHKRISLTSGFVLILCGDQSTGKSYWSAHLFPPTEFTPDMSKQFTAEADLDVMTNDDDMVKKTSGAHVLVANEFNITSDKPGKSSGKDGVTKLRAFADKGDINGRTLYEGRSVPTPNYFMRILTTNERFVLPANRERRKLAMLELERIGHDELEGSDEVEKEYIHCNDYMDEYYADCVALTVDEIYESFEVYEKSGKKIEWNVSLDSRTVAICAQEMKDFVEDHKLKPLLDSVFEKRIIDIPIKVDEYQYDNIDTKNKKYRKISTTKLANYINNHYSHDISCKVTPQEVRKALKSNFDYNVESLGYISNGTGRQRFKNIVKKLMIHAVIDDKNIKQQYDESHDQFTVKHNAANVVQLLEKKRK